jgi:dihydrofolate reductase
MRNLSVNTFISLDGVMQAPGGPDEDPTGGFTQGGWAANYFDEEMLDQIAQADPYELLLGRGTYEIFAAHWPYDEGPVADRLNSIRKYVASTTLDELDWSNSTLLEGDVAEAVAALKREDGPDLQVHGSPGLIQTLLQNDLIDELRIWTFPVLVGDGKRLFGSGTIPAGLKLVDTKVTKTGVIVGTYERFGEIDRGMMGFDEPTERELERRRGLAS